MHRTTRWIEVSTSHFQQSQIKSCDTNEYCPLWICDGSSFSSPWTNVSKRNFPSQITMVEISLDEHKDSTSSLPLLIIYSIVTCLLVGVHLLALMISKCVLTQLNASIIFNREYHPNLEIFIEIAWILSTGIGKTKRNEFRTFFFFRFIFIFIRNRCRLLDKILLCHTTSSDQYNCYSNSCDDSLLDFCLSFSSSSRSIQIISSSKRIESLRNTFSFRKNFVDKKYLKKSSSSSSRYDHVWIEMTADKGEAIKEKGFWWDFFFSFWISVVFLRQQTFFTEKIQRRNSLL